MTTTPDRHRTPQTAQNATDRSQTAQNATDRSQTAQDATDRSQTATRADATTDRSRTTTDRQTTPDRHACPILDPRQDCAHTQDRVILRVDRMKPPKFAD